MSSKPTAVELDFLGLDRQNNTTTTSSSSNSKSQLRRLFDRKRSFRGVQNAITKIDPELLKASMASFSPQDSNSTAGKSSTGAVFASRKSISVPSSPKDLTALPALPVYNNNPAGLRAATEVNNSPVAAPLTIFYNGTVSVFELPQDKAETILKFVEQGWLKNPAEEPKSSTSSDRIAQTERRMLQRNVSLQRFLEKRKERLTASPIQTGDGNKKKDIMH
ncbi:hypothetical protein QQ045_017394 [Rhodiola kirilowii]